MTRKTTEYFGILTKMFEAVKVNGYNRESFPLEEGMDRVKRVIQDLTAAGGKVMFIGNGASAAIASHMATDFWKNAEIRAMAFNDASGLTCISNDFGYSRVFEKPIERFADPGDLLIAISSSGQSENILRAVAAARAREVKIITFSGFDPENPLRKLGELNFYVPSFQYGIVEIVHLSLLHCLVDFMIKEQAEAKEKITVYK